MRKLFYITLILALTSCNALHHSIKKSSRHNHEAKIESSIGKDPVEESTLIEVQTKTEVQSVDQLPETIAPEVEMELKEDEVSPEKLEKNLGVDEEITEEDLAARRKFDKNYRWTLISSIVGAPVAITAGMLTFNPIVMLAIMIPFLLFAATLATFQVFKVSGNVPDSLVDKKFHRRYIFADIVMIVVFILMGLALLGLVSRYL